MSEYLELPWSVEDTIENLNELKDGLQERCIIQNLHGRGEKDAEEIAFDFDRAINALEEIQQYRAIGTLEECRAAMEKQKPHKWERRIENDVRCPFCGTMTTKTYEHRYCSSCGHGLE